MTCGVYLIKCKNSGRGYVGSSKDVRARWRFHRGQLNRGDHPNQHLLRAWNKYGAEAFEFSILEECSLETKLKRENYWIKELKSFERGYNQRPLATPIIISQKHKRTLRRLMIERNKTLPKTALQIATATACLIHVNKTLPHSPERRRAASRRAKRMHKSGLLAVPVHTREQRANSSRRMREVNKQRWFRKLKDEGRGSHG